MERNLTVVAGGMQKVIITSLCFLFFAAFVFGACSSDEKKEEKAASKMLEAMGQDENVEIESDDDGNFKMKFTDEKTGEEVSWDVKDGKGKIVSKGKDGKSSQEFSFGTDENLPEGWPEDFPLYNGERGGYSKGEAGNQTTYTVSIVTDDSPSRIEEWYKEKLPEEGYEITGSMSQGDAMRNIQFKSGNEEGNITIMKHRDKVSVINNLVINE